MAGAGYALGGIVFALIVVAVAVVACAPSSPVVHHYHVECYSHGEMFYEAEFYGRISAYRGDFDFYNEKGQYMQTITGSCLVTRQVGE